MDLSEQAGVPVGIIMGSQSDWPTMREAAAIQTFPPDYKFAGTRGAVERQIGNAVPVRMAARIAGALLESLEGRAA